MKTQQHTVNFITLIVILTIGIQVYWNYIQYDNNRNQVINDLQSILDKVSNDYTKINSHKSTKSKGIINTEIKGTKSDSIQNIVNRVIAELQNNKQLNPEKDEKPSISYTIIEDSINLAEYDKMLKQELIKKNYKLEYNLTSSENGVVHDSIGVNLKSLQYLTATSQLNPVGSSITINLNYSNPVLPTLLKGLTGIVLSFLLCCIIIFTLYYLLYIINKQKQLSEIKNDFISNVTHEFKTPIATVSSAIEAIKNFNNETITDKTNKYLDISEQQLKKLNLLVEKVMETSLLESSELNLDKHKTELIKLLKDCTEKHQLNTSKNIIFESNIEIVELNVDEFHFENAISNLIDNAIKYGGTEINVLANKVNEQLNITISDNGEGILKEDEPYIFDKFFRAKSKANQNVKGFGIGLYYTKNIIEKHSGTIKLKNRNSFLITLWIK